ncbi:MAG: endolytic transglycosylase MltG [Clostridia bacterium]|nr:endolytic transglycosylase MltG [Clostridia bacterium]
MSTDDIRKNTYEYAEEKEVLEGNLEDSVPPRSSRSAKHSKSKKRRRRKKNSGCLVVFLIFMMFIMGAVLFAFFGYNYIRDFNDAVDADSDEVIEFTVKKGMVTTLIAEKLEQEGLVTNEKVFIYKSKLLGLDNKYKAGTYQLSPSMTMEEIMEALQEGIKRESIRFTIPEGLNLVQIGEKLEESGVCKAEDFYAALEVSYDYDFLEPAEYADPTGTISQRGNRLEGLLFPDTYEVYSDVKPEEIVDMMLAQFNKKYTEDIAASTEALGLTFREVCTIASLIERECRVDEERPVVASVIFNRLDISMKLQLDCTVQYARGEVKERLTLDDTKIESPFNTYYVDALPAGPISNFGLASLKAAVNPADTEFLYYVARNDGTNMHNFAVTYGEFTEYKQEYLNTLD